MSKEECPVCRDQYTSQIRKTIECPNCHFTCCLACFRQFILSSATEPVCMQCKVQFNYEFLMDKLPISFWNKDYKEFRRELLLSREEALLPDTQSSIVRIRQSQQFWKYMERVRKAIQQKTRYYRQLSNRFNEMNTMIERERNNDVEIDDDNALFMNFDDDNNPLLDEKGHLVDIDTISEENHATKKAAINSTFIHACPSTDCRGFLRGDQTKCPVCTTSVCLKCLKQNEDDHECKQEDVDTVILLRQNTKSCPSCSTSIYKISGCDQMWCTQCKTPFSWRTGQIINQTIHNPHYYEWIYNHRSSDTENIGRNNMDIPCGGLPRSDQLRILPARYHKWLFDFHRIISHTENVVIPHSQRICENTNYKSLRIDYLLNNISKEYWRSEIYRREKNHQKHTQYCQIMQTFIAVSSDWLRRMIIEFNDTMDFHKEYNEMIKFFQYINDQILIMNKRFKVELPALPRVITRANL